MDPNPFAVNVPPGHIGSPSTMPNEPVVRTESYVEAFPRLGVGTGLVLTATRRGANANNTEKIMKISVEERKYDDSKSTEMYTALKHIQEVTGAKIDESVSKDQTLTLVVKGSPEKVREAGKMVLELLTKEASLCVRAPKEFHRFILGKGAWKLNQIQETTGTHIKLPRADDSNADAIIITGPKNGLHEAARMIQAIVDEQLKNDRRVLNIPAQFHQLLCGANNQILNELTRPYASNVVRVIFKPKVGNTEMSDEIIVTGHREPVAKVSDELLRLYEIKKKTCKTLNLTIAKPKHKYIIGRGGAVITEIFAETGVAIRVPPSESDSDQVTLFGEGDKIGNAVSLVLQKADSSNRVEVAAPGWLQRYLRTAPSIEKIKADCQKVHIDFATNADHITLEGPTQDVDKVQKVFEEVTSDLLKRLKYAEVRVNPKYYRHLIGRHGKQIQQLRNETGVNIMFPEENAQSDIIRIEGEMQQVEVAKRKLMEVVARIENEKSREIPIEKRYHRFLIDKKKKLYETYPDVYISFPKQEENTDTVEIRGPKKDVDLAYRLLQKMYEEVKIENYQSTVNILKDFHKRIIGKHGANVARIREQAHVEIDLPPLDSDSTKVSVRGRKENVEKAIALIEDMQKTFENISEIFVDIPHKFHEALIGPRGAGVKAIQQECKNILIRFPSSKDKTSEKIRLVGPDEEVERARKLLIERANDVKDTSYSEEMRVKPEFHRYLIGRNGSKVLQIYDETRARVIFPESDATGDDADVVVIIGREADVKKARKLMEANIRHLEETKEQTVQVEPAFHKHFVSRKGMVVNMIASECGGVTISFPRQGTDSNDVVIKGPKDCVAEATRRITEEVDKLKRVVTLEVPMAAKHRRSLLGRDGSKINRIMKDFDVNIIFPQPAGRTGNNNASPPGRGKRQTDEITTTTSPWGKADSLDNQTGNSRETSSPDDSSLTTTTEGMDSSGGAIGVTEPSTAEHSPTGTEPGSEPMMTVQIIGLDDTCAGAREALLALIPVTEDISVPHDYHRLLIGQKGAAIRSIMDKYDVNVKFPDSSLQSDNVRITGTQVAVDSAIAAIQERVRELDEEKEDRILRSFKLTIQVNPLLQRKLMNRRWHGANQIMKKYDVNLSFPPKKDQADDEIVITGYEAKCHEAKAEIERVVGPVESQFVLDMPMDRRIIPRLLGTGGRNIQNLMDQFKVEIIVPQAHGKDENVTIQIVGPEDDIYLCRSHLEVLQEDALSDMPPVVRKTQDGGSEENERRGASSRTRPTFQLPNGDATNSGKKSNHQQGYVLKDAPWSTGGGRGAGSGDLKNAPDLGSSHDFPAFLPGNTQQHANGAAVGDHLPPIGVNANGVIGSSPQHQAPILSWGPPASRA